MTGNGCDTMWFLPSALNVKVKKFNYARVNGRSIYDSFKFCYLEREMWCSNAEQVEKVILFGNTIKLRGSPINKVVPSVGGNIN